MRSPRLRNEGSHAAAAARDIAGPPPWTRDTGRGLGVDPTVEEDKLLSAAPWTSRTDMKTLASVCVRAQVECVQ
eukprot:CAMPEP_0176024408 /NCGR_PEP_ID=MMETSP0120_2-20121206/11927_1 /TAXON_ID=160619 /ORGANISM="Kryptoperidinium foliaceum, Strain CCMP 1326" /LENGTH=73 /DNA_ID=CAMNT_0017357587 /DNA_START=17 /DNA_END=238 /DNA_ORIENTATION=+